MATLLQQVTDLASAIGADVKSLVSGVAAKYTKPGTGIPSTDMTSAVQTSLSRADAALQVRAVLASADPDPSGSDPDGIYLRRTT